MKKQLSILGLMLFMIPISILAQVPQAFVDTSTPITGTVAAGTTVDVMFSLQNIGNRDLDWQVAQYGKTVTFVKNDFVDNSLEVEQDRIESDVWITRDNRRGLINKQREDLHKQNSSPLGTLWSSSTTSSSSFGDYGSWENEWSSGTSSGSLYLPEYDRYFDAEITSWTGQGGGGFTLIRTEVFLWITSTLPFGTILPTASEDITVAFDATNLLPGVYTGHVKIETNNPEDPDYIVPVEFTVTNGTPELTSALNIAFGDAFEGVDNTMNYTIENTGNGTLSISDITFDDVAFSSVTSTMDVAPGENFDLEVVLNPPSQTAQAGNMTITSNDAGSPVVIPLTGTGVGLPQITLSATSFTETLMSGNTNDQILNISNSGNYDLDYTVTFDMGTGDPITFGRTDENQDGALPQNQDIISSNVILARSPNGGNSGNGGGLHNVLLESSVSSRGVPDGTEWTENISTLNASSGQYKTSNLRSPMSSSDEWAVLSLTPRSMHIISEDRYFDLLFDAWGMRSGGGFNYTRTEIYHWMNIAASAKAFSYTSTVTAAANEDITLTFTSAGLPEGTYNGNINIASNVPGSESIDIPVTLIITDTAPEANLVESDLDYGELQVGGTETMLFNISNLGLVDMNITNITSDDAAFIPSATTGSISPLSNLSFDLDFIPDAVQAYNATITITTDDPLNPTLTLPVTGIGVGAVDITTTIDAGGLSVSLTTGSSDTRTITVNNVGSNDLNWDVVSMIGGTEIIEFTKQDFSDFRETVNQDVISENVVLARANASALYNPLSQDGFDYSNIDNTEWASGVTLNPTSGYNDYRDNFNSDESVNRFQSLYLTKDRKYFDIKITSWTRGSGSGGGFSLVRWESPGWLSADIVDGTIGAVGNDIITLTFDGKELLTGTYNADIILSSNDPDQPEITIPVELILTGIPVLETDIGTSVNIDPAYVGVSEGGEITISNTGTDDLVIADIVSSSSDITSDVTSGTVVPGGTLVLNGGITPSATGPFAESLTITSNDPNSPYVISFTGTILDAPDIAVTPTSFDKDITTGMTDTEVITISNSGTGTLNWNLSNIPSWITPDMTFGTITSSGPDVDVTLTIDLTADTEGIYETIINVDSDDPDSPTIEISGYVEYGGVLLTSPLSDILDNEGFVSQDVDFSNVFTHANPVTYIIATSDAGVVTASESSTELATISEAGTGSSFITVRADDGASVAYADFVFRVNDVPDATGIIDIMVDEGFATQDIDMATFFTDSDMEDDTPVYSASGSDASVVTTSTTDNILTVTEVGIGTVTLTISIDDGSGGMTSDNIEFVVNKVTGLTPTDISTKIRTWPNPVRNTLTLDGKGIKSYHLVNIQGKQIAINGVINPGNQSHTIDVSSLDNGIYLLVISTDSDQKYQMRFIKE